MDTDGDTCLHRLATYNKQRKVYSHYDKERSVKMRRERETLIAVTKFLIEKGAPLNALNSDKKTAFSIALESDNVHILDILSDSIKLSESPSLFFIFKHKIFDDRYKTLLIKLIKREQ